LSDSTESQRHRLELLQAQLATRASILHFTHAAIAGLFTAMLTLATVRLSRDGNAELHPWALGLTVFMGLYALVRTVAGLRSRKVEDALFLELTALRRTLHLDNPSVLLPR
jgi:glycerol uptake facilitator-like aquaporin